MKFVDVEKFNKIPKDIQELLLKSSVLPVTGVALKNWDAINEPCPNNCGKNENCLWCSGSGRKYKYILNKGSSRSSKTYSLIDCYDRYARENENKRLTVWRNTKIDCKKTVLNDSLKHFKQTGRYKVDQDFNKTESIFTYKNGSTYEIHGTDDEETVHGLTQDAAWLNEPYQISRDTFDQIDQRTADFVLLDLNPKKKHWSDDLEKNKRALVIHSTFKDNPLCPPEQKNKILSYQPIKLSEVVVNKLLSEKEAREYNVEKNKKGLSEEQILELSRCRENESNNTANEFNWMVYGLGLKAERPNRIFNWQKIPEHVYFGLDVPVYYGVDWGAVDPWGIVEVKYYDGALYLHEKNYLSENSIRQKLTPNELQQIIDDEEGIVTFMFNKFGIDKKRPIICDNNRLSKINALRKAGWSALPALKPPGSVKDGIDFLNDLKVYFTSSSVNIEAEQENYSRKIDRYGIVLEEPEDTDNHLMDPIRYVGTYLQAIGVIKKI